MRAFELEQERREWFGHDPYDVIDMSPLIQTGELEEPVMLGVVELQPDQVRQDTEALVARIVRLIGQLDARTAPQSANHRLLVKTGLVVFAERLRSQLCKMKYNSITYITRKASLHLNLVEGRKVKLKVQILGKEYTVHLKHDYTPQKDVEETIADYHAKVLSLRYDVEKLRHTLGIAAHFENQIQWNVYERLITDNDQCQPSLDFLREAFIYGLKLDRKFKPWHPGDPVYMRIYRRAFWKEDR